MCAVLQTANELYCCYFTFSCLMNVTEMKNYQYRLRSLHRRDAEGVEMIDSLRCALCALAVNHLMVCEMYSIKQAVWF